MNYRNAPLLIAIATLGSYSATHTISDWGNRLGNMMNNRMARDRQPGANKENIGPRYENIGPRRTAQSAEDSTYTLSETQARNYIDQCIAAIDYSLRPNIQDNELQELARCIKDSVERGTNTYKYTSSGKKYNKDKIDQYINSGILSYIEQTSYNYALQQTNNSTVARKIAESMRNNALARIQRASSLDAESLTMFIGSSLRAAVREQINRFDVPAQQNYRPTNNTPTNNYNPNAHAQSGYAQAPTTDATAHTDRTFPTPDCPVCMESFDTVTRLFLTPCGHNMCKTCAYNWCFTESKSTCPICRGNINRQQLAEKF